MLNEITRRVSLVMGVNMRRLNLAAEDGLFEGYIDLYVNSKDILDKMIKKLASIEGIENVSRSTVVAILFNQERAGLRVADVGQRTDAANALFDIVLPFEVVFLDAVFKRGMTANEFPLDIDAAVFLHFGRDSIFKSFNKRGLRGEVANVFVCRRVQEKRSDVDHAADPAHRVRGEHTRSLELEREVHPAVAINNVVTENACLRKERVTFRNDFQAEFASIFSRVERRDERQVGAENATSRNSFKSSATLHDAFDEFIRIFTAFVQPRDDVVHYETVSAFIYV